MFYWVSPRVILYILSFSENRKPNVQISEGFYYIFLLYMNFLTIFGKIFQLTSVCDLAATGQGIEVVNTFMTGIPWTSASARGYYQYHKKYAAI